MLYGQNMIIPIELEQENETKIQVCVRFSKWYSILHYPQLLKKQKKNKNNQQPISQIIDQSNKGSSYPNFEKI